MDNSGALDVLIVEDEPIEREALSVFLKNAPFECRVRTANDAVSLKDIALSAPPDVLLLDIRIPGQDGLSALAELRECGFSGKALVLTAYDVFEYAQRAMSLGVLGFLIKPVSPEALYEALGKVIDNIKSNLSDAKKTEERKKFINSNRRILIRAMLSDLMSDIGDSGELAALARELNLPPVCAYHMIGVILMASGSERSSDNIKFLEAINGVIKDALVVPWSRTSNIILIPDNAHHDADRVSAEILGVLGANDIYGNIAFMGCCRSVDDLKNAVGALDETLEESLLGGTGRVIWKEQNHSNFYVQEDSRWRGIRERIVDSYRRGNLEEMITARDDMVRVMENTSLDVEFAKMMLFGLFGEICEMLLDLRCDVNSIKLWSRRQMLNILAPNNPAGLRPILVSGLDISWGIRQSSQDERALIIAQAMEHIKGHFNVVTLESLSRHVHVSTSHLSRVFSKVLCKRFVDVVKEVRMERAKELLTTGKGVRDTALMVGYGNIAYFSTLFKQTCGVSPSEYGRRSSL